MIIKLTVIRSRGATEVQDLLLVLLSHAKFGQKSQKNREIIHFSKPQLINQVMINIWALGGKNTFVMLNKKWALPLYQILMGRLNADSDMKINHALSQERGPFVNGSGVAPGWAGAETTPCKRSQTSSLRCRWVTDFPPLMFSLVEWPPTSRADDADSCSEGWPRSDASADLQAAVHRSPKRSCAAQPHTCDEEPALPNTSRKRTLVLVCTRASSHSAGLGVCSRDEHQHPG